MKYSYSKENDKLKVYLIENGHKISDFEFNKEECKELYVNLCEVLFKHDTLSTELKTFDQIDEEKYKEIFDMKKEDLLYLIENLMIEGKLDISDITICHTKFLENKLAMKDEIIHQADNCIFESVFTDSLGKPADDKAMLRKLEWLDKAGQHNMNGIFEYLKNHGKSRPKNN